MTRLFRAALFLAALFVTDAANAQTATQDINITATVTKACSVNNAATGTAGSATIPITAAGNVNAAVITPTGSPFAAVACNAPSNLQLTSLNGALTGPATASGFANIINYSASATWNSITASINTATTAGSGASETGTAQAVSTASSGNLTVSITPAANSLPLVLGTYTDTLRVTLTPQ